MSAASLPKVSSEERVRHAASKGCGSAGRQVSRKGWGCIFGMVNFKSSLKVSVVVPHAVLFGVTPLL